MTQIKNDELLGKIGNALKELRKSKGILQADFGNDTGIHIARVESGTRNLTISSLSVLTDYLDIKLSDFFKLVEKQK
ncbi:helix-turn-helix domain-containing protein [Ferruginibacter sp. HRS2-29]|uniref:helix-turn-helix domain-containing protein n=1 Tax=Ferruginibacter sp. HRS2-29 TaxID=2487334 RepID=UPI0020CDE872|nr:helix-turn-helix transcriptional regulator [Ferruginibacter sp. HRS2-29]MCP9751480.1 XRE family transcriptional regulator [Ferruginibacter sp. HRS2-29]MCP9751621.1 XRE family transcriptional regulator [Ferruginibacter sp. HRS2-29]MCP9751624.1 XRE family transcriptional regulator [Ferruginibacter sp. HRS2-29]MCP9752383.1 XRE family transcriptional regulator [Ferruginibacter sp. HRS2-29]